MNIGKRIKIERVKKGMTQQQLADTLCKDSSAISKIENGDESNQINTIKEIAAALDCNLKIDLVPRNIGEEVLDRPQFIDGNSIGLEIAEEAQQIRSQIQEGIESFKNTEGFSIVSLLEHLEGPRYIGLIRSEIQNILIDEILKRDLDELSDNDALIISVKSDYEDLADLIFDSVQTLFYEEKHMDEYGFLAEFSTSTLVTQSTRDEHRGHFVFSEFYLKCSDKEAILRKIQDYNTKKINEAESYLNEHADGFPFVCFLASDICNAEGNYFSHINERDEVNLLPGDIIYAWDKAEAIDIFLESMDEMEIMDWLEHNLIDTLIDRIYEDEMYYEELIDGEIIKNKIDDILRNISQSSESEYKSRAAELLTNDTLFRILKKDNLKKIFVEENRYEVICYLPARDEEIYRFVT